MSSDSSQDNAKRADLPLDEQQLVAYLDRELDEDSVREVEALLASNPRVQEAIAQLEQTWDALDDLERPELDRSFTENTLEMVTVVAEEEVQRQAREWPRARRRQWLLLLGGLLMAGAAGFLLTILWLPRPNQRLLRDLPVLYNLHQYRQVESIDFLRLLQREMDKLAPTSGILILTDAGMLMPSEQPVSPADSDVLMTDDLAARRRWVLSLDGSAREQLAQGQRQLEALSPAEKVRIRSLHDQLQKDAERDELRQVMQHYCRWLATLRLSDRLDLQDLPVEERVARVAELRREQLRRMLLDVGQFEAFQALVKDAPFADPAQLSAQDRTGFQQWLKSYIEGKAAEFVAKLPSGQRDGMFPPPSDDPQSRRRQAVWRWTVERMRLRDDAGPPPNEELLTDADLAELRRGISPPTSDWLGRLSKKNQRLVASVWIRSSVWRFMWGQRWTGEEEWKKFLEDLPKAELERVLSQDADEVNRELARMFFEDRGWPGPFRGGEGGPDRPGPFGGRPNRPPPGGERPDAPRWPPREPDGGPSRDRPEENTGP
jgi:hypothetical protein